MSKVNLASQLRNVSERDRKQIERAEEMLGPDPETMGLIKNIFWGGFREELIIPYPEVAAKEVARCDQLLAKLDRYLRTEHPATQIDHDQEIPEWVRKRLFDLGVMGMIIPREYGGGEFGIGSYSRVLQRIGRTCGSTAVLVSAHQSIGCGAILLFGTEQQKRRFLPRMAKDMLSAFCLSEPNVGCDAAGQVTRCELSDDGEHYILNGEKKWATSGALSGLFTVMARQEFTDPETGKTRDGITALICTPDLEGIDIYSRNRSKCGIRGTWQARMRFTNVKVPVSNRLHREGKGLNVALTCLNFGRCTLSAGMVGAANAAMEQAIKWAQYRHQFDRPIGEFELIQSKIAAMSAYTYAMDAMLYATTGFVDRGDEDIMLETALCKVFCSEMGVRTVDHAVQIMGGEGYMTENEVERHWRDSRINTIVEGANEVMHSFVFAYGSKQIGEFMLDVRGNPFKHFRGAVGLGLELYLRMRRPAPAITRLHPSLGHLKTRLEQHIREFSHQIKVMLKTHREQLITRQLIQERLSQIVLWIAATACCLSRLDKSIRDGTNGEALADETKTVEHLCALADEEIAIQFRGLRHNADRTVAAAVRVAMKQMDTMANSDYVIPESTPDKSALGTGREPDQTHIQQFGSGSLIDRVDVGA